MTAVIIFTSSIKDAFAQVGMQFPGGVSTERNTRFSTNGKQHDKSGWLRPFPDGLGAAFGNWRDGTTFVWQMREN